MGKKSGKKKERKRKARKRTPTRKVVTADEAGPYLGQCITGFLPGGMFIRPPEPDGLPIRDTLLGNHVRCVEDSPSLAGLPEDERQLVLASLSATVLRAEYHLRRFCSIRVELDKRRELAPGDVFWDGLGRFLHFELQAFTAAARTALDELAYLIARIHGAASKKAREKPWATNDLFTKDLPSACEVSEVHILREYTDWYDWLNTYRNASFHHGWVSGAGHFNIDSTDKAASSPSMNALLLPDRDSLRGRRKPFEWTWDEGNTVDDLVQRLETGFRDILTAVFERAWATPTPDPGTMPEEQRPTMLVTMPRPVYATIEKEILIPLFTSKETANDFMRGRADDLRELHRVPVVRTEPNVRRVYFSTVGIEEVASPENQFLHVVVDPKPTLSPDGKLTAIHHVAIEMREVLADEMRSVSMDVDRDDVFMWRTPIVHDGF